MEGVRWDGLSKSRTIVKIYWNKVLVERHNYCMALYRPFFGLYIETRSSRDF